MRLGLPLQLVLPASGVAQRMVSGTDRRSEKGCGQFSGLVQLELRCPGRPLDSGGQVCPPGDLKSCFLSSAQALPFA